MSPILRQNQEKLYLCWIWIDRIDPRVFGVRLSVLMWSSRFDARSRSLDEGAQAADESADLGDGAVEDADATGHLEDDRGEDEDASSARGDQAESSVASKV